MYRPSIDSRLKCYDPPGTGSQNKLKAALKKLFCDICETLISFQHKLEISGTIGITIDSESVLLLQFSEAFLNRSNTTPAFHDHDDVDVNCTKMTNTTGTTMQILHKNNWTFASDINVKQSNREKHQVPCCRSSSNIKLTDGDIPADNISKNSSGSNLANSSDSNDCTIGFSHFEGRPPTSNGVLNAKNEPSLDSTGNGCDVSEMRPPRRNSSMLSQLLQRPPSNADVFGSVLNHVWPAPASASEMLKKMSSRVDSIGLEEAIGSEAKTSNGTKPDFASSSLAQGKTSPGSSYLRELLFQKSTGHQGQKTSSQRASSERKRKKTRHEMGSFTDEINKEENSQCSIQHNPQLLQCPTANSKDSGSFSRGHFFSDNKTGSSPNSNPEFSEYRYSMLLHKLVDVRRNQHVDSSPSGNGAPNSIASRVENDNQGPRVEQSSRFDGDPLVPDLWSQEIKVELADRELLESPKSLMKFDMVNHITENNHEDSDAY